MIGADRGVAVSLAVTLTVLAYASPEPYAAVLILLGVALLPTILHALRGLRVIGADAVCTMRPRWTKRIGRVGQASWACASPGQTPQLAASARPMAHARRLKAGRAGEVCAVVLDMTGSSQVQARGTTLHTACAVATSWPFWNARRMLRPIRRMASSAYRSLKALPFLEQ